MQELEKILEEIEQASYINIPNEKSIPIRVVKDIVCNRMNRNDGWIPVEERLPTKEECEKDNNNFLVQVDSGERFSCEYDPEANGYDNPQWCCNIPVVAWRPLPEPYRPERRE